MRHTIHGAAEIPSAWRGRHSGWSTQPGSRWAGTEAFLCLKGNAEPASPGRGRSLPVPVWVKITSVQPGVLRWGSWSGSSSTSQQDPQSLHCWSLDSLTFPPFFCFSIQQLSTSVTQKVKISHSTRSSTRGALTPSTIITLGPDSAVSSKLTRQSEQPFQLYSLEIREKNHI